MSARLPMVLAASAMVLVTSRRLGASASASLDLLAALLAMAALVLSARLLRRTK